MRRVRGLSLVEVLVALAIVSIALIAGFQASDALLRNAGRQSSAMLAHLCAENQLIALRLARQLPGTGESLSTCQQAGRSFEVQLTVSGTPNPSFRRVDALVLEGAQPILRLSTVLGRP